jgi:twinkle protein
VFRLPRKLKFIKSKLSPVTGNRYVCACVEVESVPVKCIAVDSESHLYLAGEAMIPTHNTDVTTQVALSLVGQEERVCVASFEMKPVTTIGRMARMFAMINPNSEEFACDAGFQALDQIYDDFGGWASGRLWLYDQTGTAKADTVLGMVKYCANELGITHVFIDSLMKCVSAEDDYNGQKAFVDQLCAIAKDCDVHVHLVHHLKKPSKEGDLPDKHDTKGSGSITDQVDNLFMVWRNKPKEDDHKLKGSESTKRAEPDCYLLCRKQRNYEGSGEGEPSIKLWRHRDAGNFVANAGDRAQFFPNYPHVESR